VLVVEREASAGGIPRHCAHTGFGVRDLRRMLTGPAYAKRLVDRALAAGAEIRTHTMVTGWAEDGSLLATSPAGRIRLAAPEVILATGRVSGPARPVWWRVTVEQESSPRVSCRTRSISTATGLGAARWSSAPSR
jgi:hypothetical protein